MRPKYPRGQWHPSPQEPSPLETVQVLPPPTSPPAQGPVPRSLHLTLRELVQRWPCCCSRPKALSATHRIVRWGRQGARGVGMGWPRPASQGLMPHPQYQAQKGSGKSLDSW